MKNRRKQAKEQEPDPWMLYPVIHKTISASSQRERTIVIIGTREQIALLEAIADSLQRGTLIQDMARLVSSDRPSATDRYGHGDRI